MLKQEAIDNNLDPFGFNDNNYLNEAEDFEEEPKKISGGTASWLEDTDKLNLPSRFYNTNAKSSSGLNYKEKNLIHGRDNLFDRTNSCNLRDKEKEKDIKEELEIEKMKSNRLQLELDKLRTKKEIMNSKNILQYIHKISYDSLGLGKKIGQGGFSEIYESQWMGIPIAVKVIFDPNINEALLEEFNNEVEKLFILRHPYIIQIINQSDQMTIKNVGIISKNNSLKLSNDSKQIQFLNINSEKKDRDKNLNIVINESLKDRIIREEQKEILDDKNKKK